MKCTTIDRTWSPIFFDFFVGAPSAFPCTREALPYLTHCEKHATKAELLKAILHRRRVDATDRSDRDADGSDGVSAGDAS
jgi:hypothetical protein